MEQTTTLQLGALRLDAPEAGLPDGALVAARGARPVSVTASGAEYEVVGTPAPLFDGLAGLLWADLHVRQQPSVAQRLVPTRDPRKAALVRLVCVRRVQVGGDVETRLEAYPWDERLGVVGAPLVSALLPALQPGARLTGSLAAAGSLAVVVLSAQSVPGAVPEPFETLVLHDDEAVPLGGAPLPTAGIAATRFGSGDPTGFLAGDVVVRVAYRTAAGYLPAGPPVGLYVPPPVVNSEPERAASHELTVTLDAVDGRQSPLILDPAWARVVTGWGVFVSVVSFPAESGSYNRSTAFDLPFRLVATGTMAQTVLSGVRIPAGGLGTAEALGTGDLSYARLRAATALAFNGRTVLGGASLDYPLPRFEASGGSGFPVRLGVELDVLNGTLTRVGPVQDAGAVARVAADESSVTGYPDRRARRLVVYHGVETGGVTVWRRGVKTFDLYAPPTANLAALVATASSTAADAVGPDLTDADVEALNAQGGPRPEPAAGLGRGARCSRGQPGARCRSATGPMTASSRCASTRRRRRRGRRGSSRCSRSPGATRRSSRSATGTSSSSGRGRAASRPDAPRRPAR